MKPPPRHITGHTRRALASSPGELLADVPAEPPALFWRPLGLRCEIYRDAPHASGTQDASPTARAGVLQTTPRRAHAAHGPGPASPRPADHTATHTTPHRQTGSPRTADWAPP